MQISVPADSDGPVVADLSASQNGEARPRLRLEPARNAVCAVPAWRIGLGLVVLAGGNCTHRHFGASRIKMIRSMQKKIERGIMQAATALRRQGIHDGRIIAFSKTFYVRRHPDNFVVFNAQLYTRHGRIIKQTDFDLSQDGEKLAEAAREVDENYYIPSLRFKHDERTGVIAVWEAQQLIGKIDASACAPVQMKTAFEQWIRRGGFASSL